MSGEPTYRPKMRTNMWIDQTNCPAEILLAMQKKANLNSDKLQQWSEYDNRFAKKIVNSNYSENNSKYQKHEQNAFVKLTIVSRTASGQ